MVLQIVLMLAHDFPETAPGSIANDGAAKPPTCHKTSACCPGILNGENREDYESAPLAVAGRFDAIKI